MSDRGRNSKTEEEIGNSMHSCSMQDEEAEPLRPHSVKLYHAGVINNRSKEEAYGSANKLPLELLVLIFQYTASPDSLHDFMNLRLVNSRFAVTLLQEQVWKEIFLSWFFGRSPEEREIGLEHVRTWRPISWYEVCRSRLLAWARRFTMESDLNVMKDVKERIDLARKALGTATRKQSNLERLRTGIKAALPSVRRFSNPPDSDTSKGQLKGMIHLEYDRQELSKLEQKIPKKLNSSISTALPWARDPLRMIENCSQGLGRLEREILQLRPEEINERAASLLESDLELEFYCPLTLQGTEKYLKNYYRSFESKKKLFCTLCQNDVHVVSDVEELIALKGAPQGGKTCIQYMYASPNEVKEAKGKIVPYVAIMGMTG